MGIFVGSMFVISSEKLFNNEKKTKLANNRAIRKVTQSDAIVVLTLLFLT